MHTRVFNNCICNPAHGVDNMKKKLLVLSVVAFLGIGFVTTGLYRSRSAYAANSLIPSCTDDDLKSGSTCKDVTEDQTTTNRIYGPNGILTKAAALIAWIGGVASVIMIILGGFTFITGSSDPNTLSAAKKTVLYAVVGLVVIVLPSTIIRFVLSKL